MSDNPNMETWEASGDPPSKFVKPLPDGRGLFSVDATWMKREATRHWGKIGMGWGYTKPEFTEGEGWMQCTLGVWFKENDEMSECIWSTARTDHIGNDTPKVLTTSCISKALSDLGIGGNVYLGIYEGGPTLSDGANGDLPAQKATRRPAIMSREETIVDSRFASTDEGVVYKLEVPLEVQSIGLDWDKWRDYKVFKNKDDSLTYAEEVAEGNSSPFAWMVDKWSESGKKDSQGVLRAKYCLWLIERNQPAEPAPSLPEGDPASEEIPF